ncbi:NUDIX hydrolase [Arcticibacterium luteifluviistationis]|uniref:NUDIX hydrolase n=1 Tax=Arcticibacterium luteifluviistationis TaxID=1784714 RepID=A0A2Z4GCH1_9BACT|nr:NUDIX domain-containing protein [Arcticibacterium luteifluviistationis]AWV98989.1 NUDIX hydrolase [Arcticibacterium luteifluviistationis]
MVIFINDRPIYLIEGQARVNKKFDTIISDISMIKSLKEWRKKILIPNANDEIIMAFFKAIKEIKKFDFKSITFLVEDLEEAEKTVFDQYKIVDAAGGLVLNKENKILMIHRLNKWDFPKGKAEKGETIRETALREVEEECNIKVALIDKYYISYHTYLHKNQRVLKRTYWYQMQLISDINMAPQKDEGIDDVRWMNTAEMYKALHKSYPSILNVVKKMMNQELSFSKG